MEVEEVFARFRTIKHGIKAKKKATSIQYGEHKSGFTGSGYDIVGVEQWRPGQPLKDVAWNLSLRTFPDKLYRIERMEPKELRTMLVVDLSSSTLFQLSQDASKALLMLDLIGDIGLTRANARDPVGLLGFSDQVEVFVRPKLGTPHVFYMAQQIFEKLAFAREFPMRRRADYAVPLSFLAQRLKSRHSIVLISDFVDLANDPTSLDIPRFRTLAAKHDVVALVLDDPDEFLVRRRFGYIRVSDMETGKQTVMSARQARGIRQRIEERRRGLLATLKNRCGIDSTVLTPTAYTDELSRFLVERTSRSA